MRNEVWEPEIQAAHDDFHGIAVQRMQATLPLICLGIPIIAGCSNRPGALELRLVPGAAEFAADGPIRFKATLRSSDGTVCIAKPNPYNLDVELRREGQPEPLRETRVFLCGTPFVWMLPFWPFLYIGSLLDVADAGGRFAVITEGHDRTYAFDLLPTRDDEFLVLQRGETEPVSITRGSTFEPGRYSLVVRLQNGPDSYDPPPLFWTLYGEPVEATATLTVRSPSAGGSPREATPSNGTTSR